MMDRFLIVSFLILFLFAALFVIPGYMMRRAGFRVIEAFCEYDALEAGKARERQELGLQAPDLWARMFKPRDYRPPALIRS